MDACTITPSVRSESPTGRRLSAPVAAAPHKWEEGGEDGAAGPAGQRESLLWLLPDELLMHILGFLEAADLTSVLLTCKRLHALAQESCVLARVGFTGDWPTDATRPLYQRAAREGNFEANMKLGVACLYGEGCAAAPGLASEMLMRAEQLAGPNDPFSWLLYRPPWSSDTCSKALIFRDMLALANENRDVLTKRYSGIMYCVAKTLWLQHDEESRQKGEEWFKLAAERGCGEAAFEMFNILTPQTAVRDVSQRLESIRYLREHGFSASHNVQMTLCNEYVRGNLAGATQAAAVQYVRRIVDANARPATILRCDQGDLDRNGKMRYILVDWLVEVVDLKQFSRDTLYMTVGLVDLYLAKQIVLRKSLQLLGIACMVIAARFSEAEVITIREAAWLTDNTYRYEQVVRTMGQALCVARGRLRSSTHLDFVRMFIALAKVDFLVEELMHYVSELVLLFMSVATSSPSHVAAAVFYLTQLSRKVPNDECWPQQLQYWTDLSVSDFAPTVLDIHKCCFSSENVKDHRGVELKAVDERYQKRTGRTVADEFNPPVLLEVHRALAEHHVWPEADAADMEEDDAMASEEITDDAASPASSYASAGSAAWATPEAAADMDMDVDTKAPLHPATARAGKHRSSSALTNVTNGVLGMAQRRAKRSSSITTPLMPEMPPHPAGFNAAFEGFATFEDSEL
eukprot:m.176941 g.176941  ORF g.176941 m.176941 type:complete len:688 (-) comp14253_c0_seq1:335-2398(-)